MINITAGSKLLLFLFVCFFCELGLGQWTVTADEFDENAVVNATITSEKFKKGDPEVDEGETRNPNNFPKHPELYIPIPFPEVKEIVNISSQTASRWVSYNIITGEEVVHENPITVETLLNTERTNGFSGGWNKELKEIKNDKTSSQQGEFLSFTDLLLVDNPWEYPWRVNCKLFMSFPSGFYVGSGVLIDAFHVLTAGHCVNMGAGGPWAYEIVVVPGYEDGVGPYGVANAVNMYSFTGWIDFGLFDYDMGIIALDRPIGAMTGWHGYGYNDNDSFFTGNTFNNPGYPAVTPYDGEFMFYWFGNYDYVDYYQVGHFNTGYGGQSGSGSYYIDDLENRVVYAVLSNGNDSLTNHVRITSNKFTSISNLISSNIPSTFDLIPLSVLATPTTIPTDEPFSSMNYLVHNNSLTSWDGTVNVSVYLSEDDNISSADTLLQTHSFSGSFDPKSTALVNVSIPPTIPTFIPEGFYWLGVMLDIVDFNMVNNESDGQDAALIYVMSGSDLDNDNIPNEEDNCPSIYNPGQEDSYPPQGNGCGDACECEGNFDGDSDQDGQDAFTFKVDFGRSSFKEPCESGNPCDGDFDCDNDCDGIDAFNFKQDFGRSDFKDPCPASTVGDWCTYP